jgi:hypothetical protein
MNDFKISNRILKAIDECCKDDQVIADFIKKLIIEETFHDKYWRWKDTYIKELESHFGVWDSNEDK